VYGPRDGTGYRHHKTLLNRGPLIQIHHALLCPSEICPPLLKVTLMACPLLAFQPQASIPRILPHAVNFEFLLRKMRPLKTTPELTDYTAFRLYSIFGPSFSGSKKALLGMLFSRKSALSRVKPSSNHGTEFRHSRILNTPTGASVSISC
jgi:hypothetical protein